MFDIIIVLQNACNALISICFVIDCDAVLEGIKDKLEGVGECNMKIHY